MNAVYKCSFFCKKAVNINIQYVNLMDFEKFNWHEN